MIEIVQHTSSSYAPRTYANAKAGHCTLAIAVDFNTAGEKCTKKAAGASYVGLPYFADKEASLVILRLVWRLLKVHKEPVLNIAGNGIYTLAKHGVNQAQANKKLYDLLQPLVKALPTVQSGTNGVSALQVVSGGQTGIDTAGVVAGSALGLRCRVTLPHGYIQRFEDKQDVVQSLSDIEQYLISNIKELKAYD